MNKENILEYNGQWHKKGKDGKCEPFTMKDLEELLKKERGKLIKDFRAELKATIEQARKELLQEDIKRLEGKKKVGGNTKLTPEEKLLRAIRGDKKPMTGIEKVAYNQALQEEINYKKEQLKQL
jgi:hypothetical protein